MALIKVLNSHDVIELDLSNASEEALNRNIRIEIVDISRKCVVTKIATDRSIVVRHVRNVEIT